MIHPPTNKNLGAIACGAKESTYVNNVFTVLNLGVVLFVIIAGLFKGTYSKHFLNNKQKTNPLRSY